MFRGLSVVARRSGLGVLLNPTSYADGDLLDVRIAPSDPGPHCPAGVSSSAPASRRRSR